MNLYDKASLILTPNAYKASKLYALKPTDGSGDLALTRAATAFRRNPSGLLESVANNVPRIHHGVGGACPTILLEPQRTNIVTTSSVVTPSDASVQRTYVPWALSSVHNTAQITILSDSNFAYHRFGDYSAAANTTYQLSFFVKKVTGSQAIFGSVGGAVGMMVYTFNFDTLAFTIREKSADVTVNSTTAISMGSGYYRIVFSFSSTSGITVRPMTAAFWGVKIASVGDSWEVTGAQLEAGNAPSAYIPTSGSTATRVADALTKSGISSLIGQTTGTLFLDFVAPASGDTSDLVSLNASYSNAVNIINVSGGLRAQIYSSLALVQIIGPTIVAGARYKCTVRYSSGASVLTVNGVHYNSAGAFTFTGALSSLEFTNGFFSGVRSPTQYNSVMIFPTLLSAAECIALTT